jgi:hypothetical protein
MDEKLRAKSRLMPALIVAGLLALYPLSIGPAAVMLVKGRLNEYTYSVIYSPLDAVCDHWRPARRAVNWYGWLWLRACCDPRETAVRRSG